MYVLVWYLYLYRIPWGGGKSFRLHPLFTPSTTNTEGAIKNEQSRETGNIGYTRRRKTKQTHNTICVEQHYTQIMCLFRVFESSVAFVDYCLFCFNKGNNKITELRTIFQRESQNS